MELTFFDSSPYGAAFYIHGQKNVDNTTMFYLLLNNAYTAPKPSHLPTVISRE